MKPFRNSTLLALAFAILAALPVVAPAQGTYTEDFTTTTYMDVAETTADWNTATGELKLFPFAPSFVSSIIPIEYAFPMGIAVAGDYAILADGETGIDIIDISDPAVPSWLGGFNTGDAAHDVAVDGDFAFVAYGEGGMQIFDISDGTSLSHESTYGLSEGMNPHGIAVAGNLAFIADLNIIGGLVIVDITDPAAPVFVGSYVTPGSARDVAISGDHAFVADGVSGLQVLDISDPSNPTLADSYSFTMANAHGVAVSGNLAFVAASMSGLQIIDITDPTNLTLVGSYDTPGLAKGVTVSGDLAFVADGTSGLQAIDISDPTNPSLAYGYDTPGEAHNTAVAGELAYVADGAGGLQVIAIRDAISPVEVSNLTDKISELTISGDYAYTVYRSSGQLRVLDISDPSTPVFVGTLAVPDAIGIDVSGDIAYVAQNEDGFATVDISDPTNPSLLDTYSTGGDDCWTVRVSGDYAFAVGSRLWVFDVSDPTNITNPATPNMPGESNCLVVSGNYVYISNGSALLVYDVSDPANPSLAGSYNVPGYCVWVAVSGDLAMLVDLDNGTDLLDVSDPTNPMYLGTYSVTGGREHYVAEISGDRAFFLTTDRQAETSWVEVVDISDPTNPNLVHSYERPNMFGAELVLSGDFVFLSSTVQNVVNRFQMIRVYQHEFDLAGNVGRSVEVAPTALSIESVSLLATQIGNVSWELTADAGANWQTVPFDGTPTDIVVPGSDLRWRATLSSGASPATVSAVQIDWFDYPVSVGSPGPLVFGLRANQPNPFQQKTNIAFDLPRETVTRLEVIDVSGRRVRTLVEKALPAGSHTVSWDGRNESGHRAAAGVYFYRLRAGSFESTKRMVLLR